MLAGVAYLSLGLIESETLAYLLGLALVADDSHKYLPWLQAQRAAGRLVVKTVEVSARGTIYVLERASDGARASVNFSGKATAALGTAIAVTAIGSGYVLSAAGEALQRLPTMVQRPCTCLEPISLAASTTPPQPATLGERTESGGAAALAADVDGIEALAWLGPDGRLRH